MFIKNINDDNKWKAFLDYKLNSKFVSKKEKEEIKDFIVNEKYKNLVNNITDGLYSFSICNKHIISKNSSTKKRVVYSFNDEEMMFLKYISYLLYDYDYLFQRNLYSFRKNVSVKNAIDNIKNIKNTNNMYGYKVDIKNYFNSIDVNLLLNNLKNDIDEELFEFIKNIIGDKRVCYKELVFEEEKGAMAGIPISAFLANYYIKEIDEYFSKEKLVYLRYSDDIILFCNSKEEIMKYSKVLKDLLKKYKLIVNNEKEYFYEPGDRWDFLGLTFYDGVIDLSTNTISKIKGKIRRSARSIKRWKDKNNVSYEKALKVMNNKYNKKFYGKNNSELSWRYWFFPVINTDESLKVIDKYFQDNLRYIATGKHNKKNYKIVPYEDLKQMGYRSLVHEYHLFINMKSDV